MNSLTLFLFVLTVVVCVEGRRPKSIRFKQFNEQEQTFDQVGVNIEAKGTTATTEADYKNESKTATVTVSEKNTAPDTTPMPYTDPTTIFGTEIDGKGENSELKPDKFSDKDSINQNDLNTKEKDDKPNKTKPVDYKLDKSKDKVDSKHLSRSKSKDKEDDHDDDNDGHVSIKLGLQQESQSSVEKVGKDHNQSVQHHHQGQQQLAAMVCKKHYILQQQTSMGQQLARLGKKTAVQQLLDTQKQAIINGEVNKSSKSEFKESLRDDKDEEKTSLAPKDVSDKPTAN